jgi:hypothetical protein
MTYNKKEAERLFLRLAKKMNKEVTGHAAGTWYLDSATHYGGYVIEEQEANGGVRQLFGRRLPCREFCKAVEFALDVLDYQENNQ